MCFLHVMYAADRIVISIPRLLILIQRFFFTNGIIDSICYKLACLSFLLLHTLLGCYVLSRCLHLFLNLTSIKNVLLLFVQRLSTDTHLEENLVTYSISTSEVSGKPPSALICRVEVLYLVTWNLESTSTGEPSFLKTADIRVPSEL